MRTHIYIYSPVPGLDLSGRGELLVGWVLAAALEAREEILLLEGQAAPHAAFGARVQLGNHRMCLGGGCGGAVTYSDQEALRTGQTSIGWTQGFPHWDPKLTSVISPCAPAASISFQSYFFVPFFFQLDAGEVGGMTQPYSSRFSICSFSF